MIPKNVLDDIIKDAKKSCPDDKEMQRYVISEEKTAYEKIKEIDLGEYNHIKENLIALNKEIGIPWEDVLGWIPDEVSACKELETFHAEDIGRSSIESWKQEAEEESDLYTGQLEFLQKRVKDHRAVIETKKKIDPIKKLIIEMEEIIGSSCYNSNIQNYSSWGELETEGRSFRYPVRFITHDDEIKRSVVSTNTPSEVLITGHYAFGANELEIYRALHKVVQHLQENYGLKIDQS